MSRYEIHDEQIYEYYESIIKFNIDSRKNITDEKLTTAINLNIILNTACLLEGFFEDRGMLLLGYYREIYDLVNFEEFELRKPKNVFFNNIQRFLSKKISQTTGIENYNTIFELLTDSSFIKSPKTAPFIEGINVLFQFRNVIAHGRQVHFYEVEAYFTNGIEENFNGGYKRAETYCIKKGLLSKQVKDGVTAQLYFTNEIADHFFSLATNFIKAFDEFLEQNMLFGETLIKKLNEHNTKYNTNLDMKSYLRERALCPY